MAKLRKLWKVTQGWTSQHLQVDPSTERRPESQSKAYAIYVAANVANASAGSGYDHTDVWVDERDGHGWQHYERINHDGTDGNR